MTTDTTCVRCGARLDARGHTMGWVCQDCQHGDEQREDYAGLLVALSVGCFVAGLILSALIN